MTQPPTIDTLEATRALMKAGLDQPVAEEIVRVIDTGLSNGAASAVDLKELDVRIKEIEIRVIERGLVLIVFVSFFIAVIAGGFDATLTEIGLR